LGNVRPTSREIVSSLVSRTLLGVTGRGDLERREEEEEEEEEESVGE
jgi:hypothetical protein